MIFDKTFQVKRFVIAWRVILASALSVSLTFMLILFRDVAKNRERYHEDTQKFF